MASVTLVAPDGVTTRAVSTYAELEHYLQARGYVPQSGTATQAYSTVTGIDPSLPPVAATSPAAQAARLRGSQRIKNMALTPPANPPTMTSPPTVAVNTTATAGLTKQVSYQKTTLFRWDGPLQQPVAGAGAAIPRGYTKADGSGVVPNADSSQTAFDFDGASFDIWARSNTNLLYRLWVNEQAVTTAMQSVPGTNGAQAFINVNFGSASLGNPRRIVVEFEDTTSAGIPFLGLQIAPTDSVTFPSIPSPRVIVVGDSFAQGMGTTHHRFGYAKHLGRLMGWADCWDNLGGVGGTGLVKDASATAGRYLTRLAGDVIPYAPDLVIIQGSVNDTTFSGTGVVGPALITYVNTLRAALPNVAVVVTSVLSPSAPVTANSTNSADLATAAAALGIPFLNVDTPIVFTGTGRVGATAADGNADVYRASDNTHPTDAGHAMFATALAGLLGQALGIPL
jgi:lysophospholipase L1-like esterase